MIGKADRLTHSSSDLWFTCDVDVTSTMSNDAHAALTTPPPELVKFNVGHVPFVLGRDTLSAYPDSLLYALAKTYEDSVANGEYIYVDRDPTSFPWVIEIYRYGLGTTIPLGGCLCVFRDGRYKSQIPDMLVEELQKDLTFYKLPSLSELGISNEKPIMDPIEANTPPLPLLFRKVVSELTHCGAIYLLPVDVIVYFECKDGYIEGNGLKILVAPLSETKIRHPTDQEDHEGLLKILRDGCVNKDRATLGWGKKIFARRLKKEYWIIDFSDDAKRTLLDKEAEKWDMEVVFRNRAFGKEGKDMTLNLLVVQYKETKLPNLQSS